MQYKKNVLIVIHSAVFVEKEQKYFKSDVSLYPYVVNRIQNDEKYVLINR
jgi:hypothetical protein